MTDLDPVPDASPPRPRRRVRPVLVGSAVLVALVALAPFFLGPALRPLVVGRIEDELDARAKVRGVSFRWPARLRVEGLELTDPGGAPLASLDAMRVVFALGPLLRGRIECDAELEYPEVHLARAADGRLNWEKVLAKRERVEPEEDSGEPGGEESVPEVRAHVRVADGHVVLHGPSGDTVLTDIALDVDVDGLERPAPFHLAMGARGPHGPAGTMELEGSFTAAPAGRIALADMSGDATLTLEQVDLAGFAPALALVAPVGAVEGRLQGRVELGLAPGLALTGASDVELDGLVFQGPRATAPTRIARVELRGSAAQPGEGSGTQHLELRADPVVALVYDGTADLAARATGELEGQLSLTADLGNLSEIARGWMPLQEGVQVQGKLEQTLELTARLESGRAEAVTVRARGGVTGLAARDASGGTLDLSDWEGIQLDLDAALDLAAGTLTVPELGLRAGPITCAGRVEARGLAEGDVEIQSGALRVEADLEQLRGALAQIFDIEGRPFGGRFDADITLGGEGGALDLAAKVEGRALALAGTSLEELAGDLSVRRGTDGALTGKGALLLGALQLARAEGEPLVLPPSKLDLALQEDATGRGEHALDLATDDGGLVVALRAQSERPAPGELALRTTLQLDGRVASLAGIASVAPLLPGLAGKVHAQGEGRAAAADGALVSAGGRIDAVLSDLEARDMEGKPLALEALRRTTVALELEHDPPTGRCSIPRLEVRADGLELRASATVTGLAPGAADPESTPALEAGRVELEADLARLGPELARIVDLSGWSIAGAPLSASADLHTQEGRIAASGHLGSAELRIERPERPPIALADVAVDFDLGYDPAHGSLEVRKATASSQTATLELSGTLEEMRDHDRARGEMQLAVSGTLERILGDLGLEDPESGRRTAGALDGKLALEGDRGAFSVTGRSAIERFRLELAARGEEPPLVIEEPTIALEYEARVALAELDVEVSKLVLTSGLARGGAQGRIENLRSGTGEPRLAGWTGQLVYVPERLGAVLAPLLPGKLTGTEEERVTFSLDCGLEEFGLATVLTRSNARVDLGLGHFERPEIQLDGSFVLETNPERAQLSGDLDANGGTLRVDGALDLAAGAVKPRSELDISAKDLRINSGLGPLLALIHPAFATASVAQGTLEGVLGLDLDVTYDAPLTVDALKGGWTALPKQPINGSGRFELRGAALRGAPLLETLAEFGVDVTKSIDIRPIEFTIREGRITYAKPWTWSLAGTETTFTGSIGLDKTLDLSWNVPVTDALVERWSFLSALKGTALSIPIRGTVTAPKLEAGDILADLAARVAKRDLEDRLGLGGGGSEDPAALLTRADELWGKGQKSEAALLYTRLREDYKLSLTYALNKDRIKDRSKYKEPPK